MVIAMNAYDGFDLEGCLISEKFDGINARWNGRVLITRDGVEIAAPKWFTDSLPNRPLTGELWVGRGRFEDAVSYCMKSAPVESEWEQVKFMVFTDDLGGRLEAPAYAVERWESEDLESDLDRILALGGEGLVIRDEFDFDYKLKPLETDDAEVVGYKEGAGKLSGVIGSIRVRDRNGNEFSIGSGIPSSVRQNPPAIGAVIEFTYQGRTSTGKPRNTCFDCVRAETSLDF